MRLSTLFSAVSVAIVFQTTTATLATIETTTQYILENDRLYVAVNKSTGAVQNLLLDGQDLLGASSYVAPVPGGSTGNGETGLGPYLDCYCKNSS